MDKKHLLWNDKMKSARRRKRLQKEDFEKKLLAIYNERIQLFKQIANLGYKPLVPPVQKGWKRVFALRDDVKRSARSEFFEELLLKINTVQYSDTRKFKVRRRKKGKKVYVDREQTLRSFYVFEWEKLKLTDAQRCFFQEVILMNEKREFYKMYVFREPWRYVSKVIPNIITQVKIKDALLEQRLDEIGNYLERRNLEGKLGRLLYGSCQRWWAKSCDPRNHNPLLNKPLNEIIATYTQDK